jgi:hypothetical protein
MSDEAESRTKNSAPTEHLKAYSWRKGVSGNPGGRPKGLAHRIRQMTENGQTILDLYLGVATGKIRAPVRDQLQAAAWLTERGWGKTPDITLTAELDGETAAAAMALSTGELQALAASLPPGDMTIDAVPSDVEAFSPSPGDASPSDDES